MLVEGGGGDVFCINNTDMWSGVLHNQNYTFMILVYNIVSGTNSQQTGVASAAFMAVMIEGFFYPSTGEIIPFERVLLNVGQHYDDRNSVFTCAESGLYLFSVTLYSGCEFISYYIHLWLYQVPLVCMKHSLNLVSNLIIYNYKEHQYTQRCQLDQLKRYLLKHANSHL